MRKQLIQELTEEILEFMPLYFKYINPIIHKDERFNLNENQIKLIMILNLIGSQTPTNLSVFMDIPKGSLTTIIDSLVDKGFITRKNDINDRRKKNISLTEKGLDFISYKSSDNLVKFSNLFKKFDEESIKKILIGFKELSKNLRKIN